MIIRSRGPLGRVTIPPMASKPHSADLRKGRRSAAKHCYHVTTSTLHRRKLFTDWRNARAVITQLCWAQGAELAKTIAFVVMPDHLHWILELGHSMSLNALVGRVKGRSSRLIATGSIWQSGFHDHAIRQDEDLRAICRYVIANPLRAGLVTTVCEYPHWDCVYLDRDNRLDLERPL